MFEHQSRLTEQDLIEGLQTRDENSYRWLLEKFQEPVYNTILGIVQSVPDAEDLAQEVFLQVFRSIDQFKGASKLSTWIYRIATTKSLDHLRSRKSKKRFAFLVRLGSAGPGSEPEIPELHHPGVVSEQKERAAQLFRAISQLPENQKTAIVLTQLEHLSQAEVSEVMQISVSAVESLLYRARTNLRNILEKEI